MISSIYSRNDPIRRDTRMFTGEEIPIEETTTFYNQGGLNRNTWRNCEVRGKCGPVIVQVKRKKL